MPQEVQGGMGGSVPFPSRLGCPVEYVQLVEQVIANPMINGVVLRLDGDLRMSSR